MRFFRITSKKRRRTVFSISGGIAFGLVISLLLYVVAPLSTLRENLTDRLYLGRTTPPNVVIAAIDEKSLSDVGLRIPEWPRSLHATAVDNLAAAGARVIVFDVLFAERSADDADDADLARAVREAGNVIMPVAGIVVQDGTEIAGTFVTPPLTGGEYEFTRFVRPKSEFVEASLGLGHANMPPGPGDKVRHIAITASSIDGDRYPTLSAAAVMAQLGGDPSAPIEVRGDGFALITTNRSPRFPKKEVPVNDARGMRVNFAGGPGAMPSISYIDIINNSFDPEDVSGKIVFIGATAAGIGDTKATPIGDEMPGVEVHANSADTILRGEFLTDPSPFFTLATMLAMTLIVSLTVPLLKLLWSMLINFVIILGYVFVAATIFQSGIILEILSPMVLAILMFTAMMLYKNIAERAERNQVTGLFGTYVGKGPVADAVLAKSDTGELGLGGERAMLSLIFTDIRGFSTFSEKMTPNELVNFLNEYLTAMTDIVFDEEGVLDKYIGDAVMAFWGWPKALDDHAARAMRTSINMISTLEAMQGDWVARGLPALGIRTGINSGEASVGNMGSKARFSITAMGDTVNLAARLEPINNQYGTDQMISGETLKQVNSLDGDEFVTRFIDLVAVKGRSQGTPIHELMGFNDGSVNTDHLPAWLEAIALYDERKYREAGLAFKKVLEINPDDGPPKLYVDRCEYFVEEPPEEDWDGVFVMKTK